jgi:hypothetical protein
VCRRPCEPLSEAHAETVHQGRRALTLCLGAAGIVYGDIGTSPIYAIRECSHAFHGVEPTPEAVLGVLSLIFWALVLVISAKYLFLVMRADNHGEGGIIALTALVSPPSRPARGAGRLLVLAGLFGAALLYGDSMITPAISVLSAVEGLRVATPVFDPFVLPITVLILVALFSVQSRGTARVGAVFGPIPWDSSRRAWSRGAHPRHLGPRVERSELGRRVRAVVSGAARSGNPSAPLLGRGVGYALGLARRNRPLRFPARSPRPGADWRRIRTVSTFGRVGDRRSLLREWWQSALSTEVRIR